MPAELENDLRQSAAKLARGGKLRRKKGMTLKEAEDAYTYGTMRKIEKQHRAKGGAPGKYMKRV